MIGAHEAIVFDFDGVIADTEPLHWRSWRALLSQFGFDLSWEQYLSVGLGVSDREIYERLRTGMRLPDEHTFTRLNHARMAMVRAWSLEEVPVAGETVAMLGTLEAYRVGLVTSSQRPEVEPVLSAAGIRDRFDAMVFGGDAARPKPSPEPYLMIAQRLGVPPGIAFEDSEAGLASARAAGFRAVRVDNPASLPRLVALSIADTRLRKESR